LGARTCFPDKTGLTSAERRPAKARSPPATGALPQKIAGNAFSKHFRHFLVTLNEWVIPRKRRGKLDSDPKMNQTEWRLPVHEQPRSVVAVNQSVISWDVRQLTDETTPQPIPYPKTPRQMTGLAVFCSDRVNFRSRQEQSCPTTADETTPYPTPISENSSANGCSRNFEIFSFFLFSLFFFGGGARAPHPRLPASYAYEVV